MTIQEAKELKKVAEKEIGAILSKLQNDTQLAVTDIHINTVEHRTAMNDDVLRLITHVAVDMGV